MAQSDRRTGDGWGQANELEAQARHLEKDGQPVDAEESYRGAAEIDLQDKTLQAGWTGWGGPLNGQRGRQRMVEEIIGAIAFDRVVETGTFYGSTTEWLASRFAGPILSSEVNRRYFLAARERLRAHPHVEVRHGGSTDFLRSLAQELPGDAAILFLFDAHGRDQFPLADDLAVVRETFRRAVVVIDDFEVPLDRGYTFDNYGTGRRIDLNMLRPMRAESSVFLPALASTAETGARRGACVITWDAALAALLREVKTLRACDDRDWLAAQLAVEIEASLTASRTLGRETEIAAAVEDRVQAMAIGIANAAADAIVSPSPPGQDAELDAEWGPFLAHIRRAIGPLRAVGRETEIAAAVEDRVKTMAIGIANAAVNAMLSPSTPGEDAEHDARWGPFLTHIRKAIRPLRVLGREAQIAAAVEDRMQTMVIGVAHAAADAILSPSPPGQDLAYDNQWGQFLNQIRQAVGPLRVLGQESPGRETEVAAAVEERVQALAIGVANAVADAILSPSPPGEDAEQEAQWGPFLNQIRTAVSPLRSTGDSYRQLFLDALAPLAERLERTTAAEIELRADLARLEYRAIVAERDNKHTQERLADHRERSRQEESIRHRIIADLERQLAQSAEALRASEAQTAEARNEIAHLRTLAGQSTSALRTAEARYEQLRGDNGQLRMSVSQSAAALQAAEARVEQLRGESEQLRMSVSQSAAALQAAEARVEQLRGESEQFKASADGLKRAVGELSAQRDKLAQQLKQLRKDHAELAKFRDEAQAKEADASAEKHELDQRIRAAHEEQKRLQQAVAAMSASRWIKLGTSLGLSKLDTHLNR